MSSCSTVPKERANDPAASIDQIAAGIEKHVGEKSQANGGYFGVRFKNKELRLQLVRVHLEYLSYLGDGVSFACVDLVSRDGPVYDVDFFMKGPPGAMAVTETCVHKINGRPLYLWEQRKNGTWRKVPARNAPRKLLDVVNGSDE